MDHIRKFVANIGLTRNQSEGLSNSPRETPTQHQDGQVPLPSTENKMRHRPEWVKKSPWMEALTRPMTSKGKQQASGSVGNGENGGSGIESNRTNRRDSINSIQRETSPFEAMGRARSVDLQR